MNAVASTSRAVLSSTVRPVCTCRSQAERNSDLLHKYRNFKTVASARQQVSSELRSDAQGSNGDGDARATQTVASEGSASNLIFKEDVAVLERRRRMAIMSELEALGSTQTRANSWQPHHGLSRPTKPASLTMSHLLASTAHLGHATSEASPYSFPFTYGTRHGISIIDVRETLSALRRAANLVRSTVENDGIILYVGGGSIKGSDRVLQHNADKLGKNGYAVSKWLPGTLTNASKLFASSATLIQQAESKDGNSRNTGSLNATSFMPSVIVLFAPLNAPHVLREANTLNIPTIALCDTNIDPRHFTYPIPCNDDSLRVIELISGVLSEAGREGARSRAAKLRKGQQGQERGENAALQEQFQQQQYQERRGRIARSRAQ